MAHTDEASEGHKAEGIDTMIEIKVKTMNSETHNLHISNQLMQRRVWNLKEHVSLLIGMPMEQQCLIYCGKVLQDDDLLSSYNIQHGDTLHLVCTVQSMSSFAATDGISPDTQQEIPNSIECLSQYLSIMRREYSMNGTENNTNEVLESASNTFTPSQGIPEVEQLARLMSSTRDMLISQTAQRFLELERDLRQSLNVGDPRVRQGTQLNAQTTIGSMFNNLGAYFLELGHAMMGVQMGDNGSTAVVNAGPAVYITDSGPLSIQEELYSVLLSTIHGLINSGLVNDNDTRLHQRQVGTQMIGGATVNNVVDNAGILGVSSGPSIIEPRSAHESAGEPANEDVGTSHRQTADFAESPSYAKRRRME